MQRLRPEPFPTQAARDLLGLVRALWLVAEPGSDRRRALTSIGLDLVLALDNARIAGPGTPYQATAWFVAERAVAALGELVGAEEDSLTGVVRAAMGRVCGRGA